MLDKSIASGKEHRQPYHGAKSVDRACRNHGSCAWCAQNRKHGTRVRSERAAMQVKEIANDEKENYGEGT